MLCWNPSVLADFPIKKRRYKMSLVKLILGDPVLIYFSYLFNSLFWFLFSQALIISYFTAYKLGFLCHFLKIKTSDYLLSSVISVLWIPEYNPQHFCDHMYNLVKEITFPGLDTWITQHLLCFGLLYSTSNSVRWTSMVRRQWTSRLHFSSNFGIGCG